MTFIASIIAKEGVAIVADSFVTTVEHSMEEDNFFAYLSKKKKIGSTVHLKELLPLFEGRASYTRNYMDKLFQFGDWSAITTTGQAYINDREIKSIVEEIKTTMDVDSPAYTIKPIEQIILEFCDHLKPYIINHLTTKRITNTAFIFSHYNSVDDKARVFSIKIASQDKGTYTPPQVQIEYNERSHLKIVTDGQDTIADRLIFGSLYRNIDTVKDKFLKYLFQKIKLKKQKKQEIKAEVENFDFIKDIIYNDLVAVDLRELSLQEAVDLAALLIKIVMDIQIYTEKIPTVGGLIRLATISKGKHFQWVSGDKTICPKIIL